jgi:hypothetical protein
MVHVADQQLTYLRTLDEAVGQNTKDIIDLVRILRYSTREELTMVAGTWCP